MPFNEYETVNKFRHELTFADRASGYFFSIDSPKNLTLKISTINPFEKDEVKKIVNVFFKRYFEDNNCRVIILGINPGRFGGGVTGIPFTDPVALEKYCGIGNSFAKKTELSSKFIYNLINTFGGVQKFYSKFFISALYPLALIKDGRNYNYYDDNETYTFLKPRITDSLRKQISLGVSQKHAVCLGRKNYKYLKEISEENNLFENISVLDHPRFIMQYRNKFINKYIDEYIKVCSL